MKTKREQAIEQIELMDEIRNESGINMVTCGHCGTILLHRMDDSETVHCFGCGREEALSDCPDYWYEGCQDTAEFYDEPRQQ